MAVDKLVDSTQLDVCCTAEANAIRAKTGDLSQIAYDWANSKGFADAIAAIPSGGGTKEWTYIDTYTATETVHAVEIPVTSYDYDEYALAISGVQASAAYIMCYLATAANTTGNNNQVWYSKRATTFSGLFAIIHEPAATLGNVNTNNMHVSAMLQSGNGDGAYTKFFTGAVTSIIFRPFDNSNDLLSGTEIKLYGRKTA